MDTETDKDGEREVTEETLNSRKAIWLRKKNEVKPETAKFSDVAKDQKIMFKVNGDTVEEIKFRAKKAKKKAAAGAAPAPKKKKNAN